ncbi:alkylation response protein AidB-like acyl-CoA dehydrogenase [Sphingomonas jinjuensis]|uniref:Alkylation response protein AidB-like acyl-CoA dehydrogenase n=1 Tax=Sphingomonas jinjuensis TaxID=535907 RepID=A0A840FHS6_9SPHN|nr:acyl-CoA dehydrogenase family protein [Sphingomonas jinjuensis]MBB4155726.1 alkylation response protein AidB-like acyl-CoA dehydrogenase [Sphingomonas jinjuensis]
MATQPMFFSPLVDTADHHRELRESVGRLVGKFGRKYYQDCVKRGVEPEALWQALGEAGFLGVHIPEEHGGSGGGIAEYNVVVEEAAAQGCPLLQLVINSITAPIIAAHGSEAMKAEWLPGIAAGTKKICFAITEPDAGSNTHKVKTSVTGDGDGFVLNGSKYWTSGINVADAVMIVARDADIETGDGRSALSLFLVPTDAPGLSYQPIDAAVMTPEKQFVTFYDNIHLDARALIGKRGAGLRQVFVGLNPERISAAAINNGIARFALAQGAAYARDRSVWGIPIAQHQGVAHPLAEAYIHVQAARLLNARAAQLFDLGEDAAETANMAKFMAADASLKALDQAIQVHGGNGLSYEYGLADLWFIARLHKTAPVSREMVLNHVAQHGMGLPKSY